MSFSPGRPTDEVTTAYSALSTSAFTEVKDLGSGDASHLIIRNDINVAVLIAFDGRTTQSFRLGTGERIVLDNIQFRTVEAKLAATAASGSIYVSAFVK